MNARAGLIGSGDGSVASVTFTTIYTPEGQGRLEATDLEFNPDVPEQLWIVSRQRGSEDASCVGALPPFQQVGCGLLEGITTVLFFPGEGNQLAREYIDPNSWHFMRRPPAIAFGNNQAFATCGEARTANFLDEMGADFIGPTLWSSDLEIFAQDPGTRPDGSPLNGSHLDMLHATPWCVGIAHEVDNVYWLFNGNVGSIDRYDFNEDHGPGEADHSDGEISRYVEGDLLRVPNVPSHMEFHDASRLLFVADTGNKRIVSLDTTTGTTMTGMLEPVYEPLAAQDVVMGATLNTVIDAGTLEAPSGLVISDDDVLYVTDNATGRIHAFELDGTPIRTLDTPYANGELAGIAIGPDNKLYLADLSNGSVHRIDP